MRFLSTTVPVFALASVGLTQNTSSMAGNCTPATEYFDQAINHNGGGSETFKQQYQVIDQYFKPGGPIFFYQNGENAQMRCLEDLILPTWAEETGGLAVTLEHRFFGDSLPNNDDNLTTRYETMTTDNIMLDAVEFIKHIKGTVSGAQESKVIAVGISYSAYISAILRINYPTVFDGAINMASPIRNLGYKNADSDIAFEYTSEVYEYASLQAAANISYSLSYWKETMYNVSQWYDVLTDNFNLCTPIRNTSDMETLYDLFIKTYLGNGQGNYSPGSPFLKAGHQGNALTRLITGTLSATQPTRVLNASLALFFEGQPCVDRNADNGYFDNAEVPYGYVLCRILPMHQESIPNGTIFPSYTPPSDSGAQYCIETYGVEPVTGEEITSKYHSDPDTLASTTRLLFTSSEPDYTSAYEPLELFDTVSGDLDKSRLLTIEDGGRGEDGAAPFTGQKATVTFIQNVEMNIIKLWLGLVANVTLAA